MCLYINIHNPSPLAISSMIAWKWQHSSNYSVYIKQVRLHTLWKREKENSIVWYIQYTGARFWRILSPPQKCTTRPPHLQFPCYATAIHCPPPRRTTFSPTDIKAASNKLRSCTYCCTAKQKLAAGTKSILSSTLGLCPRSQALIVMHGESLGMRLR